MKAHDSVKGQTETHIRWQTAKGPDVSVQLEKVATTTHRTVKIYRHQRTSKRKPLLISPISTMFVS